MTPRSRRLWVLLALAGALAVSQFSGCGESERAPYLPAADGAVVPSRVPPSTSAFRERSCWRRITGYDEQCGTVTVPESPGASATLEIGVVRVFSDAENPAADPVVYLDGGPGNATIEQVDDVFPYFEELVHDRDVIFIDQRGTGVTEPPMACDDSEELTDCFTAIGQVTDPAAYTTANNARDIELVRQALGYDKWNVLGISYGTRLGLTLMRDHPGGLRSVILDGVVPLEVDLFGEAAQNGEASFEKAFAACAADEACRQKYPNPMAELLGVVAALNEKPLPACDAELSGEGVVSILFNLLYSPVALAHVPRLIHDLAEGDTALFEDISCNLGSANFSFPMHLSLQCAEEIAFTSTEAMAALEEDVRPELVSGLSGHSYLSFCSEWPVPAAPAVENQMVVSALPTLIFAGFFDPVTPPRYSEQVHAALDESQYFLVQNESHGASLSPCGLTLARAFLNAPTEPVQATCLSDLPPPSFEALRPIGRRQVVGRRPKFVTDTPTAEDIAAARDDLKRRIRL
jgi:pimeloyl-ACP methyl ester carboxylesterase